MSHRLSNKLLTGSALVAVFAASPMITQAADINVTTNVTTIQTATTNNDTISVTGAGDISVVGDRGASVNGGVTGVDIIVNTTGGGISANGNNIAIDGNAVGSSVDVITVTDGLITSDSTNTTIALSGVTSTITISTGVAGSITNTAAGGDAIVINDDDSGQTFTVIVNNAGNISSVNNPTSAAIYITDADSVSSLDVNNTGTLSGGALGYAVSAAQSNTVDLDNTGSGAITGRINGTAGLMDVLNADTATINGNISTATGNLVVGVTGGIVTGNISTTSGDTNIDINGGTLIGAVNLGSSATGALDVTTGTLTGNVTLGNVSQVFTYSGGTFTGTTDGAGQFHIDDNHTNMAIGTGSTVTEVEIGNAAKLTLGANITATNVNVDSGEIDFGSTNRIITGNLIIGGVANSRVDIQDGAHVVSGVFTMNAGDTLGVNITGKDVADVGSLAVGSVATVAAGSLLDIDFTSTEYIADGTTYTLVDGAGGAAVTAITGGNIDINSGGNNKVGLLTFTTTGGSDLVLVASRSTLDVVGDDANSSSLGDALEIIGAAGTDNGTEVETFVDAIIDSNSFEEANVILESGTPATDNSLTQGIIGATTQSVDVAGSRLTGARGTGLSSGDALTNVGVWFQGYGGTAKQENIEGVNGYDADTYGIAFGIDKEVGNNAIIGLSGSYGNTEIDNNSGLKSTDVDSYQVNLYGSWSKNSYYVDGIVGVAYNKYNTSRDIPTLSSTAKADFDGKTYIAKVSSGRVLLLEGGVELTPNVALTYAHNTLDDYSERGAGAMNLDVQQEDSDQLEAKIGVNVAKTFSSDRLKIRPELKLAIAHDFIGDEQQSTSNFSGIATTFRSEGAGIEKTSFEIGTGVDFMNDNGLTFSADYDLEVKSDYKSHIGSLKMRYNF